MIRTGSILEKLCAAVDKYRNRVARAERRVEDLRDKYRQAPVTEQRHIAAQGFKARKVLERAQADLAAAELALKTEEERLLQPDSFLRFA